jgi:hypothetical protein
LVTLTTLTRSSGTLFERVCGCDGFKGQFGADADNHDVRVGPLSVETDFQIESPARQWFSALPAVRKTAEDCSEPTTRLTWFLDLKQCAMVDKKVLPVSKLFAAGRASYSKKGLMNFFQKKKKFIKPFLE